MTDTVVQGPWPTRARGALSARANEIDRVERDFRQMGRRDDDVFQHLAMKVSTYLAEAEHNGHKSGSIGRIIGGDSDGTARHRNRFSWNGSPRDFKKNPLTKNPGQWLAVLRRCAEELRRPLDDLMLDAFTGSRLRPLSAPTDFTQASWLQSFLDLMIRMEDRLCGQPEVKGLLEYIAAAYLEFDNDGSLVEADEPILPWFRADVPDWKEMLYQLPYTRICSNILGGYSYRPDESMEEREKAAWRQILEDCQAEHLAETHHLSLVMMVRRGLAIIPGEDLGRPRLALFKWPNVSLIASNPDVNIDENSSAFELPLQTHPVAGEILYPTYPDYPPHLVERVSFAPVGTDTFNAIATEFFAEYQGSVGGADESCWDPLYADEGTEIEWASSAPKATVAAMIERNLLFADLAGVPEQRLDRLLQVDLDRMVEAVRQHRARIEQIVSPARRNLLATWSDKDPLSEEKDA